MSRPWQVRTGPWDGGTVEARILRARGLDPAQECHHDPFLMLGMRRAVERIQSAIARQERILVFGDYDADGVTSSTLLKQGLKDLGARVTVRLPHRVEEGYGLQLAQMEEFIASRVDLLITADNGSTALAPLELAAARGLDVIVVDHHSCLENPPPCVALLNPRQAGCAYPFKSLAAVGVAWKLLEALGWKALDEGLDLVALGTVADLARLTGENRLLVRRGLALMQDSARPGIRALLSLPGVTREGIDARTLGWQLGPRINSAGRLAEADLAHRLLDMEHAEEARVLAERLDALNSQRRAVQDEAVKAAEGVLARASELPALLMFVGADWHLGVIGLIAGRLAQTQERPTLIMTRVLNNGLVKGSARSVPGLNITEAIARHGHLLENFGGHAEAAGLTVREEKLQALMEALGEDVEAQLEGRQAPPVLIDSAVEGRELDISLPQRLLALEPCGSGNPRPQLGLLKAKLVRIFEIGNGKHFKCWVESEQGRHEALWWSHARECAHLKVGDELDIAFEPRLNEWNGRIELQLMVNALRLSAPVLGMGAPAAWTQPDGAELQSLPGRSAEHVEIIIGPET